MLNTNRNMKYALIPILASAGLVGFLSANMSLERSLVIAVFVGAIVGGLLRFAEKSR